MADGNDLRGADKALAAVMAHRLFARLPGVEQHSTLSAAAWVAARREQYPRARDLYLRATAADPGDPDDWYRLSMVDATLEDYEAAATHLTRLVRGWPELMENLADSHVNLVVHQAPEMSTVRLELLQALFDANWTRRQRGASSVWYQLALMRIERGEPEAARVALQRVNTPEELIKLRSDKRFDAIVDRTAPEFDVERAARQQLDHLRRLAAQEPTKLDLQMEISYAMLALGLHEEALAMTDSVLATIAAAKGDTPPFEDMDDQVWIMNNRAIALRRLGRNDDARAQLRRASRMDEAGAVNVSQALNLGHFYCSLGQSEEALSAIDKAGKMSGYGRMVQASVQHCATRRGGDQRAAEEALKYIREHRTDSQEIYLEALLEANRLGEAAETLIALLDAPADRDDALYWVQDLRRTTPLPHDAAVRNRRQALIARDDVRAAIDRVGRIQSHAIYPSMGVE